MRFDIITVHKEKTITLCDGFFFVYLHEPEFAPQEQYSRTNALALVPKDAQERVRYSLLAYNFSKFECEGTPLAVQTIR